MNFIHKLFTGDLLGIYLMGSVRRETTPIRPLTELLPIPGPGVFSGSSDKCDAHPLVRHLQ